MPSLLDAEEKANFKELQPVAKDQTVAASNSGIITKILTSITGKNKANAQAAFNLGASSSAPVVATSPTTTNEVTDKDNL